ncbi:glutathione S-transferase [Affinibrenneria salicis]|uniref:Glutathione S-transferase n=1 Tax=Affinibrenneria salicis TaxID=2590031 RepID=A0A5J5G3U8_9GAMM|nr:glutathione S-transferase [Affinibrenneria salicis]KAA9001323.1 glutathione S-transferase [Affinibrenneria salicis]
MIKVLGRASSINVRKVLWTCHELDLPFEHEAWGQGALSLSSPEFLAVNPNAMVPVLVDEDLVLWESNTICRYLASVYGDAGRELVPPQPRARAQVEKWMDWQATELNNAWRYAFMALVRKNPAWGDGQAVEASIQNWNRHMTILDAALGQGGPFVCGAAFTLADIVLGLSTHRWYSTPFTRPELPHVARFYQQLCQRPGFLKYGNNGEP